jgi:hypothetical protein
VYLGRRPQVYLVGVVTSQLGRQDGVAERGLAIAILSHDHRDDDIALGHVVTHPPRHHLQHPLVEAGGPVGIRGDDALREFGHVVGAVPRLEVVEPGLCGVPLIDERRCRKALDGGLSELHAVAGGLEHQCVEGLGRERHERVGASAGIAYFSGEHVAAQLTALFEIGEGIHGHLRFLPTKIAKTQKGKKQKGQKNKTPGCNIGMIAPRRLVVEHKGTTTARCISPV